MATFVRQFILFGLIWDLTVTSDSSQQSAAPLKRTIAVKEKVGRLSPQAHISVIPLQGEEEFGTFLSSDQEGFTFHDIDRKIDVSLKYEDVRKVKDGYGGYNHSAGKHTDRTK